MLAKKSLGAAPAAEALYVEDVFSTYLYSGQSSGTITISNGIDLSGEGGLVWIKQRNGTSGHQLCDTERGITNRLQTNTTGAQSSEAFLGSVTSTGFTLPANYGDVSGSTGTYTSWTFRKAEKFFDVVTYTGTGSARTVSHNLGSTPGFIIVKRTDDVGSWACYHTSIGNQRYLKLESTAAQSNTGAGWWNNTSPTSTEFTVGTDPYVNSSGATYVAYLFAHDAGGFGDAGDQSVIKCGSYTGTGAAGNFVDLGWEPQFLIIKNTTTAGTNWFMYDVLRGLVMGNGDQALFPNLSNAETTRDEIDLNATGFTLTSGLGSSNDSGATYIYIAIRRGPMKTPEAGTEVFSPITTSAASTGTARSTGFPVDFQILCQRDKANYIDTWAVDRLRGLSTTTTASGRYLLTNGNDIEGTANAITRNFGNTGFEDPSLFNTLPMVWWNFKRAPGFLDIVCYTGTGSNRTVSHNLGTTPEMLIVKGRSTGQNWAVYHSGLTDASYYLRLNTNNGQSSASTIFNSTAPTSTEFSVGTSALTNSSGATYVAYLFSSVTNVSNLGTYSGNGTSVTVTTGFQPRFVLVKRRDTDGDWVVGDSARGLVAGNDPYLKLNSSDAQDTDEDWVDISSTGFTVNQTTTSNANVNGGTYIYLAIA